MSSPVTVAVSRETDPAHIDETIRWIDRGLALARDFEGCLGGGVMRDAERGNVLHVVYRFTDRSALHRWERSRQRREWERDGAPLIANVQRRTGIEGWFDGPQLRRALDPSTGAYRTIGVRSAPPRWKQAAAVWLGMFPLNIAVSGLASHSPWFEGLPLPLRSAILVSLMVPVMTFAVMPAITRMLRPWLRRNPGAIRSERALREALDARCR